MLFSLGALMRRKLGAFVVAIVAVMATGCQSLVPPFDQAGVARITDLSKKSLAVYQTLLDTRLEERGDALTGKVAKSWSEIEVETRVHLVFEQSREKNSGSVNAARQFLGFWEEAQKQYCRAAKSDAAQTPTPAVGGRTSSALSPESTVPIAGSTLCAGKGVNDKKAMEDFILVQDRAALERILVAMVKAEEAKKLASSASN